MTKFTRLLLVILFIIALPLRSNGQQIMSPTGTLDSALDEVRISPSPLHGQISISLAGSFSETVYFEFLAQSAWRTLTCVSQLDYTSATSTTTAGDFICPNLLFNQVRARATAGWSGASATTTLRSGNASPIGFVNLTSATYDGEGLKVSAYIRNGTEPSPRNIPMVEGGTARDTDVAAYYPVYIGGCGSLAAPTAVSTAGFGTCIWTDLNGAIRISEIAGTANAPTSVNDSATNVTLVAANNARIGLRCTNTSTAPLHAKFGATATTTSFSVIIPPNGYWNAEKPVPIVILDGIWASDPNAGAAICQEILR